MGKKGCVLKDSVAQKVKSLNVDWYYTWNQNPIEGLDVPFVPMVWGKKSPIPATQDIILVLNEPDRPDQSNVSVSEALNIWNTVSAKRKGSPAVAANAVTSQWFIDFMSKARPDFICIHWYGPPHVDALLQIVDTLHDKYMLPIWITEFSVAQWNSSKPMYSVDAVSQFMKTIIPELNARPFVERFAWKTRDQSDPNMGTSALFQPDGSLTSLGKLYASL